MSKAASHSARSTDDRGLSKGHWHGGLQSDFDERVWKSVDEAQQQGTVVTAAHIIERCMALDGEHHEELGFVKEQWMAEESAGGDIDWPSRWVQLREVVGGHILRTLVREVVPNYERKRISLREELEERQELQKGRPAL